MDETAIVRAYKAVDEAYSSHRAAEGHLGGTGSGLFRDKHLIPKIVTAIEAVVAEERARCAGLARKKWVDPETGQPIASQLVPVITAQAIESGDAP
jgi:hypothetical protein